MRQCWNAKPSSRPEFSKIQSYFAGLLESLTASYGYLTTAEKEIDREEQLLTVEQFNI
jgi:hypothetical protein